jgi:hypothetical protein
MVELGGEPRLASKALALTNGRARQELLEGNLTRELQLLSTVNFAHTAAADDLEQPDRVGRSSRRGS